MLNNLPRDATGTLAWSWPQFEPYYEDLIHRSLGPENVSDFLIDWTALSELVDAVGTSSHPGVVSGIGRLVAELHTLRRMSVSVAGMLEAGREPVVEAAIVKDVGTIWEQGLPHRARDLAAFVTNIEGSNGSFDDKLAFYLKIAPKVTIQGGTTEILRGIIARGLGLR